MCVSGLSKEFGTQGACGTWDLSSNLFPNCVQVNVTAKVRELFQWSLPEVRGAVCVCVGTRVVLVRGKWDERVQVHAGRC